MRKAIKALEGVSTAEAMIIYDALLLYPAQKALNDVEEAIIKGLVESLEEDFNYWYNMEEYDE